MQGICLKKDNGISVTELWGDRMMEAPKHNWKEMLLEVLKRIGELETRTQEERRMMVEFVRNEEYDLYLMSESNLKKMDA